MYGKAIAAEICTRFVSWSICNRVIKRAAFVFPVWKLSADACCPVCQEMSNVEQDGHTCRHMSAHVRVATRPAVVLASCAGSRTLKRKNTGRLQQPTPSDPCNIHLGGSIQASRGPHACPHRRRTRLAFSPGPASASSRSPTPAPRARAPDAAGLRPAPPTPSPAFPLRVPRERPFAVGTLHQGAVAAGLSRAEGASETRSFEELAPAGAHPWYPGYPSPTAGQPGPLPR